MKSHKDRELEILGHPPRLSPLDASAISAQDKASISALWEAIGIPEKPELPEYFATMLRHPPLMVKQAEYATQLLKSALSPRHRQLAIIRIAWLCQAPFEWSQHAKNGKLFAGLTTDDVEAVTQGSTAAHWNDQDRALLLAVEELYTNAMISESTWESLTLFLDDKQLLELPLLVGYYQSVAYLQNSVRFRLMPGSKGLSER